MYSIVDKMMFLYVCMREGTKRALSHHPILDLAVQSSSRLCFEDEY